MMFPVLLAGCADIRKDADVPAEPLADLSTIYGALTDQEQLYLERMDWREMEPDALLADPTVRSALSALGASEATAKDENSGAALDGEDYDMTEYYDTFYDWAMGVMTEEQEVAWCDEPGVVAEVHRALWDLVMETGGDPVPPPAGPADLGAWNCTVDFADSGVVSEECEYIPFCGRSEVDFTTGERICYAECGNGLCEEGEGPDTCPDDCGDADACSLDTTVSGSDSTTESQSCGTVEASMTYSMEAVASFDASDEYSGVYVEFPSLQATVNATCDGQTYDYEVNCTMKESGPQYIGALAGVLCANGDHYGVDLSCPYVSHTNGAPYENVDEVRVSACMLESNGQWSLVASGWSSYLPVFDDAEALTFAFDAACQ